MLRERGQHDEADELHANTLGRALATRGDAESEESITRRFDAVLATETERVANAMALAEVLAPMLAERMAITSPIAAGTTPAPAPPLPTAAPAPRVAKPRAASIADFIDEMIAQEKPPDRDAKRRAS
jgi:hypothetical protein